MDLVVFKVMKYILVLVNKGSFALGRQIPLTPSFQFSNEMKDFRDAKINCKMAALYLVGQQIFSALFSLLIMNALAMA